MGQAFNKIDELTQVSPDALDVILIDASPDTDDALDLTVQLSLRFPQAKLVILGLDEMEETFLQFIEAGARGYVLKDAPLEDLKTVIYMVDREEAVCPPQIAYSVFSRVAELAQGQLAKQRNNHPKLTMRELEILQLIAHGLSNKQIAARINKSLFTVKNHVHNILEKLKVHYRQEAIKCAYKDGLLKKLESPRQNDNQAIDELTHTDK